jgi:CelD/BcsL family acetyltransferase involved in cellulose biosynthesis
MRSAREAASALFPARSRLAAPPQALHETTHPDGSAEPLRRPPPSFDFAVIADTAGLAALGPEWNALFARSGRPQQVFQTFAWLSCWANHYLDKRVTPAIVTGRSEGRLALVWPLVSTRRLGFRLLSFMGEPLSQYGDALVDDRVDPEAITAQALAFIMTLPVDILALRRVRDDAALAAALTRGAQRIGAPSRAPFVDFAGAGDAAAFDKRFSAKLRSDRRRHRRRLEEIGPIAFERHGPGPRARDLVAIALAFKQDWARRNGRIAAALADPRFGRFFLDAASGGANAPALRVSAMFCAGEPIGVEISIACKGRVFGHVLAPKPGFERQGAGAILAGRSIADALEEGFGAYDLLAPADPYKMEWASGCVGVADYAAARTLAGRLFKWAWLDFGREASRALIKRLRARLRPVSRRVASRP